MWRFPGGSNTHGLPKLFEIQKTTTEACSGYINQVGYGDMNLCMQGVMICFELCAPFMYFQVEDIYALVFQEGSRVLAATEIRDGVSLKYNTDDTVTFIFYHSGTQEPFNVTRIPVILPSLCSPISCEGEGYKEILVEGNKICVCAEGYHGTVTYTDDKITMGSCSPCQNGFWSSGE